eukprot:SAG31_NODE_7210_length_1754_cov_2.098489_1_plen_303_part_00
MLKERQRERAWAAESKRRLAEAEARRKGRVPVVSSLAEEAMARIFQYLTERKFKVADIFNLVDADMSDNIEPAELQETLHRLGLRINAAELRAMTAALDVDGDSTIGRAEFFERMKHIGRLRRKQGPGSHNPTYKPPPTAQRIQLSQSHPSLGFCRERRAKTHLQPRSQRRAQSAGSNGFRFRTLHGTKGSNYDLAVAGAEGTLQRTTFEISLPDVGDLPPPRPQSSLASSAGTRRSGFPHTQRQSWARPGPSIAGVPFSATGGSWQRSALNVGPFPSRHSIETIVPVLHGQVAEKLEDSLM